MPQLQKKTDTKEGKDQYFQPYLCCKIFDECYMIHTFSN